MLDLNVETNILVCYYNIVIPKQCPWTILNTHERIEWITKAVFLICRHVVRIDDKLPPLTKKPSILTTMIYIKNFFY